MRYSLIGHFQALEKRFHMKAANSTPVLMISGIEGYSNSSGPGNALIKHMPAEYVRRVMPWYIEKKTPVVIGHEAGRIVELKPSLVTRHSSLSVATGFLPSSCAVL